MRPDRFPSSKRGSHPSSSSKSSSRTTSSSKLSSRVNNGSPSSESTGKKVEEKVTTRSEVNTGNNSGSTNKSTNTANTNQINNRRSLTRSLTRSPTPIKYDYDIYQKRSPTFGRRCPVLNRRPRVSKSDSNQVTSSNNTNTNNNNNNNNNSKQESKIHSTIGGSNDKSTRNHEANTIDVGNVKIPRHSNAFSGRGVSWDKLDNPSYFQHDDRESQSRGKNNSRKRKQRQSPFRWQHDLFEDDGSPLDKNASGESQGKEAKLSQASD